MKILIAEDQVHVGRLLEGMLRTWGYEAVVVHDGLSALEALRAPGGPQLALLDWVMPGMDGIEVCRHFRREAGRPYAYLVLVTGAGGRQEMLDGLEAGADDFLAKPIDPAELRARLGTGRRIVQLEEELRRMATRDSLTGTWNRAAILDLLERERARAGRGRSPLAVILADADHFKRINDTYGHLAGDRVLREVAGRMMALLRPYDTVGRYGGEEFLIVLPGCDAAAATGLAERLRRGVAAEPVEAGDGPLAVTLSLGVAVWDGTADTLGLLQAVDAALYRAKHEGRNRAVLAGGPPPAAG
jgi:diguanylate cyclase (GGDEF)-like protein